MCSFHNFLFRSILHGLLLHSSKVDAQLHLNEAPWHWKSCGDGSARRSLILVLKPRPVSPKYTFSHLLQGMRYAALLGLFPGCLLSRSMSCIFSPDVLAIFTALSKYLLITWEVLLDGNMGKIEESERSDLINMFSASTCRSQVECLPIISLQWSLSSVSMKR